MAKKLTANDDGQLPRLVKLMDGFDDPCEFSVVRKKGKNKFAIVAGAVEGAVAVFHTPADGMDDEGHCAGARALHAATGLDLRQVKLEHMRLPQQALHLAPLVGAAVNIFRLCGGKGYPSAEGAAKAIGGFPVPMVQAGLNEYQRRQG